MFLSSFALFLRDTGTWRSRTRRLSVTQHFQSSKRAATVSVNTSAVQQSSVLCAPKSSREREKRPQVYGYHIDCVDKMKRKFSFNLTPIVSRTRFPLLDHLRPTMIEADSPGLRVAENIPEIRQGAERSDR